ncbi:TPA: ead/Ea22-like family protein [Klebsiella quasipneumoniae]|uniref:ead/Ea22-like family protein n=1 Tax=Klebsiella quasipneumoniae TaxID=1463165 RepID=UPI0018A2BB7D|nr:ead/Ea22-like family protein [Klebsiella quasipneumoniae]MBF7802970.1 ead/Ea22-like family protein [Klebsiella quasipneumoniae]HBW0848203.1 ead/Ea22-like family protein [Klebsiella quasipneumoniae]HCA6936459.1 ead/Ea22-like family protein [Klebsiella quasipneumoniae]HEN7150759.1 ead/Ea22-like family protein [Klebsiella quasipneumoniae]
MTDITELAQSLKAAAEKATPGRIGDRIDGSGSIKYECHGYDGSLVLRTDHKNMEYGFIGDNSLADEEFFRACVPDAILALVEALEKAQGMETYWKTQCRGITDHCEALQARIAELESRTVTAAAADVLAERQRQVTAEGWTAERDDGYQNSELADAAACYAIHAHNQGFSTPAHWPWSQDWWKQTSPRRDLVKAGALILAEIERLDRAAGIKVEAE